MKFNKTTPKKPITVANVAGGRGYKEETKLELVSLILSSFLKDSYYESADANLTRLETLCQNVEPTFLAKASLYARKEAGMRSVSHVIAAYIGAIVKGQTWTKKYFENIVHRPDDATEILSFYMMRFGKPIPNAMKKGLAAALRKFDNYQLAKYRGENKDLKMVDLVNLVRPIPTKSIDLLMKGELKNEKTWEAKLSATQGDTEKKQEAWEDMLLTDSMGYMALLRNIRNIMEQAPEMVDVLAEKLVNEKAIKKSLVLPFRFISAYDNIQTTTKAGRTIVDALNTAMDISLGNMVEFDGETCVVIDTSSSMQSGNPSPAKIAAVFGAVLAKGLNADVMTFDSTARYVSFNLSDPLTTLVDKFRFGGGATHFAEVFKTLNKSYKRIIILSDMQGWEKPTYSWGSPRGSVEMGKDMLANYERKFGPTTLYSWNLKDYGTLMFPQKNVACLAGWSDKAMELLSLLEKGDNMTTLIDMIEL